MKKYTITKQFNERKCIEDLIEELSLKDTVILDRGYYSKNIFKLFYKKKVNCIMRLKRNANKFAKFFFNSNKTDVKTFILIDGNFVPIRYVKYFIEGKAFIIATSLFDKSVKQIQDMYKLRWRVELSFKRLKTHLKVNKIYATSEMLWKQEMQLRILLDTITRTLQQTAPVCKNNKKKRSYRYFLLKLLSEKDLNINLKEISVYLLYIHL